VVHPQLHQGRTVHIYSHSRLLAKLVIRVFVTSSSNMKHLWRKALLARVLLALGTGRNCVHDKILCICKLYVPACLAARSRMSRRYVQLAGIFKRKTTRHWLSKHVYIWPWKKHFSQKTRNMHGNLAAQSLHRDFGMYLGLSYMCICMRVFMCMCMRGAHVRACTY
jgi:hypothetical protein